MSISSSRSFAVLAERETKIGNREEDMLPHNSKL